MINENESELKKAMDSMRRKIDELENRIKELERESFKKRASPNDIKFIENIN